MRRARLDESMCAEHRRQAEIRWPAAGRLEVIRAGCDACAAAFAEVCPAGDTVWIDHQPDLTAAQRQHAIATHEAGHALVAVATDHPLTRVHIQRHDALGGANEFDAFDLGADVHLAMLWAGQEAELHWLKQAGLSTPSTRLGARACGQSDNSQIDDATTALGLDPYHGRPIAQWLLRTHWDQVENLAQTLIDRHEMTGDEVRALLTRDEKVSALEHADDDVDGY